MSKVANINIESLVDLKRKGWSHQALANRFKVSKSTIKRKLKVDDEAGQMISDYTSKLVALTADVPDEFCRKELKSKFLRIIESLKSGAREVTEVSEDCDLPAVETEGLLNELGESKRVAKHKRGGIYNRGRKTKYHFVII